MANFERVLALSSVLQQTREPQSLPALCAQLSVSRATCNRLIRTLRDQHGFSIDYDRDSKGYVLRRGAHDTTATRLLGIAGPDLAGLLEAQAILEQIPPGLMRDATANVRGRLSRLSTQRLGKPSLRSKLQLRMNHLRPSTADGFSVLLSALLTSRRLSFNYRSRNTEQDSTRRVSPLRLTLYRSNWYLAGWCHEVDALRLFSADRIANARIVAEAAQVVDEAWLSQQLDSSYGIYPGAADQTAVLKFNALAARWVADEQWHPDARTGHLPDGSVILQVPYHHDTELLMEILRHGANCEVISPEPLRRATAKALRQAAAHYRKPASPAPAT